MRQIQAETTIERMNVLILGGQSPKHLQWSTDLAAVLTEHGHDATIVTYDNWLSGDPRSDFPTELEKAMAIASDLSPYVIVAKSIGTLITSVGAGLHSPHKLEPLGCVLLGFPLGDMDGISGVPEGLATLPRTVVMQNESDPFGSAHDVTEYFAEHGPSDFAIETVSGADTHDYLDFEHINALVAEVSGADAA